MWFRAKGGVRPPQRRSNLSMQRVSKHCADPNDVWDAQDHEFEHIALWTHATADLPADTSPCRAQGCSVWRLHRTRFVSTH